MYMLIWIYHAKTWVMNVSWRVSVCPSGTGLGNVHFWKCIFPLDMCCQQFGEYESVEYMCCGIGYIMNIFGEYMSVEYKYLDIWYDMPNMMKNYEQPQGKGMYICIGYVLLTIWGIYVSWIYVLVLDISCQHLGDKCKLVVKNQEKLWKMMKTQGKQWRTKKNNENPRKTMKHNELAQIAKERSAIKAWS